MEGAPAPPTQGIAEGSEHWLTWAQNNGDLPPRDPHIEVLSVREHFFLLGWVGLAGLPPAGPQPGPLGRLTFCKHELTSFWVHGPHTGCLDTRGLVALSQH